MLYQYKILICLPAQVYPTLSVDLGLFLGSTVVRFRVRVRYRIRVRVKVRVRVRVKNTCVKGRGERKREKRERGTLSVARHIQIT